MLTAVWHVPAVGATMSANGSLKVGWPVWGAGLMFAQPLQPPTICVRAAPVVTIWPPPFGVIASALLELTYTPQPLVRVTAPLRTMDTCVGFSVRTQPPAVP